MKNRSIGVALLAFFFALVPRISKATPPDMTAWLTGHPEIASALVFEFPDQIPTLPGNPPAPRTIPSLWSQKLSPMTSVSPLSNQVRVTQATDSSPAAYAGTSCPAPIDLPSPGKTLQWCQWPESYRQRLKNYFETYWTWMETAWPLYEQYRASGFTVKPAGFDERFGSNIDPETGTEPGSLPFSTELMKDMFTHVLYQPAPVIDLYLKTTAFQLVMDMGPYLPWRLNGYSAVDLSVILDGRRLFQYFPAGSKPWGGQQTVDKEGYNATYAIPAPPLVLMKFLFREAMLRNTRFDTVSRLLEWERFNLQHTMGSPQTLTGECGKEYAEVYWGTKGNQLLARILHGTVMACRLVPQPGESTSPYYNTTLTHYTGGCGTTAGINHRVMRQINIPAEPVAFSHGQIRFVVEKAPFEQMINELGPQLPAEPVIDDGVPRLLKTSTFIRDLAWDVPQGVKQPINILEKPRSPALSSAYLDHNDNPYGMKSFPEIPVREALIPERTYETWFAAPPASLTDEEESAYRSAHNKRVSLRPVQLLIAKLPIYLFQYFCWKEDEGKPHEQSEMYQQYFESSYSPTELENTGFWTRFEQKFDELGGCESIPPLW